MNTTSLILMTPPAILDFLDRPKLDLSDPSHTFALPGPPCHIHRHAQAFPHFPWVLLDSPGISVGSPWINKLPINRKAAVVL